MPRIPAVTSKTYARQHSFKGALSTLVKNPDTNPTFLCVATAFSAGASEALRYLKP